MDVGNVDAHLVVLLSFDTLGEGHRLSFDLAEGVELGDGLHTLVGRQDGGERTIGIILELLDGYATAEATATRQLAGVVEEVGVSLVVGHTAMIGKRAGIAQRHNLTGIGPRASGVGSSAVRDMLGNATGGVEQLVNLRRVYLIFLTVNLANPRSLGVTVLILLAFLALVHCGRTEGFLSHIETPQLTTVRDHVLVQLQVVALGISPHQPRLTVVINHHRGVDMIPATVLEERFSYRITEGTDGRVADSYADGHTA